MLQVLRCIAHTDSFCCCRVPAGTNRHLHANLQACDEASSRRPAGDAKLKLLSPTNALCCLHKDRSQLQFAAGMLYGDVLFKGVLYNCLPYRCTQSAKPIDGRPPGSIAPGPGSRTHKQASQVCVVQSGARCWTLSVFRVP